MSTKVSAPKLPGAVAPGRPSFSFTEPQNLVEATIPYPSCGASQHLVIVRDPESPHPPNPELYLEDHEVRYTVLGSAFFPIETGLKTQLEPPHRDLVLPPLDRRELREEMVYDQVGRPIGKLLQVPAVHVLANQLLVHKDNPNYRHAQALGDMVRECGRLMASTINQGILRVREIPGLMAHLQGDSSLAPDEVGISAHFAGRMLRKTRDELGFPLDSVSDLDGYPCWSIRFPLANEWGVQNSYLRILPGDGKYIAVHPWNLGSRFLGDEDGDLGFILLRVSDLHELRAERCKRPRRVPEQHLPRATGVLTLQDTLDANYHQRNSTVKKERWHPVYPTLDHRLQAIRDADTRTHVAVYTMAIGWWMGRILAPKLGTQRAYRSAYNALEWFMENCMDARKGDSKFSGTSGFDKYLFMETLMSGGTLDIRGLKALGIPDPTLTVLKDAWTISGGNLREYCATSPIYSTLVLQRRRMERHIPRMLLAMRDLGIAPQNLYQAMVEDLTSVPGKILRWPASMLP